jgi:hypothetical protein
MFFGGLKPKVDGAFDTVRPEGHGHDGTLSGGLIPRVEDLLHESAIFTRGLR